jgi:hypothetical protein
MSLLRDLLNAGVLAGDAKTLEGEYANQQEFLDGLEQIARVLVVRDSPGLLPPIAEPWKSIHAEMSKGGDLDQAVDAIVASLSPALQSAILGALQTRMADLQQWLQQATQAPGKKRKIKDYLKALSNLGYAFRYNQCSHNIEVNSAVISDAQAATIRNRLRDHGIIDVKVAEDVYLAEAWKNRYHPLRDYLTSLKWDGKDIITELGNHFVDTQGVINIWLRRWLIGSVARVMARAQNRMLVLDGLQGIGKDYFSRWICSPMPEYYHEGAINPEDKDCRLRLLSTWIWTVSELGSTTRKQDRESLKSFLTLETVRDRKPFGKYDIQGPAMTSFVGTINNEGGFLSDPTGNRRFMTCKVTTIDWSYTKLDVDQVWAQAFNLYLADEPWDLQKDEYLKAAEINETYQVDDLIEAAILKYFQVDPNKRGWWLSTVDIVETLEQKNVKFGSPIGAGMAVGRAMTSIGLEKMKRFNTQGKLVNGYLGITL